MELEDFELPAIDLGLNSTQESHVRRVLIVIELQKRAKGAECKQLLEKIAKTEKENRWKKIVGSKTTCMATIAKVIGKKARVEQQEDPAKNKKQK